MKSKKQAQTTKFKELAKELDCETDEKAFEEKLKKIIKPEKKNKGND